MTRRLLWGLVIHALVTAVTSYDPNQFWQVLKRPEPDYRTGITRELDKIRTKCVVTCSEQCALHDECNVVAFDGTVEENEPNCRLLECRPWQSLCDKMINEHSVILYRDQPISRIYVPPRFEELRKKREAATPPGEENSDDFPVPVPVPAPAPAENQDVPESVDDTDAQPPSENNAPTPSENNTDPTTSSEKNTGGQTPSEYNADNKTSIDNNAESQTPIVNNTENQTPGDNNTDAQAASENNGDEQKTVEIDGESQTPSENVAEDQTQSESNVENTTQSENNAEDQTSSESNVEIQTPIVNETDESDNDIEIISDGFSDVQAPSENNETENASSTQPFENSFENSTEDDFADIQPIPFSDIPVPENTNSEKNDSDITEELNLESEQGITSISNQTTTPEQGDTATSTENSVNRQNDTLPTEYDSKSLTTTLADTSESIDTHATTEATNAATDSTPKSTTSYTGTTSKPQMNQTEEEIPVNTALATTQSTTTTTRSTTVVTEEESTPDSEGVTVNSTAGYTTPYNQSEADVVAEEELLAEVLMEAAIEESETMEMENSTYANGTDTLNQSADVAGVTSTSHMMMVVLVSALSIGLFIFLVVSIIVGKRVIEGWRRRHYSRIDYLVNGMYN